MQSPRATPRFAKEIQQNIALGDKMVETVNSMFLPVNSFYKNIKNS